MAYSLRSTAVAVVLGLVLGVSPVVAQEGLDPAHDRARRLGEEATPSVTLSGFVDTSVFWPIDGTGNDGDVLLALDQVEFNIIASLVPGLTLRTDINVFPAAGITFDDTLLEQGFLKYYFNGGASGLFFQAGKVNAPVGVEALDPVDMYQYSHGQLFTHATPSNLTGFFGGFEGETLSAMLWVTNDWDTPPTPDQYLVGGRFQWAANGGHVGLSSTFGPIGVGQTWQLMVDLDSIWAFGPLTLFLEGNFGMSEEESAEGDNLVSVGGLFKVNYAFTDALSATVRYDYLNREYGDEPIQGHSVTGAFLFGITESFSGLVELRADLPDEGDTALTAALEFTAAY
jgi:hypothetical protein